MPLVCFLVPILYYPLIAVAAGSPRWIFLSLAIPFLFLTVEFKWTQAHKLGAAFLAWCALTLLWTTSLWDSVHQLWQFILLGGVFCIGSTLGPKSYRACVIAFAVGIAINAPIAAAQAWGWEGILTAYPRGAFFLNKNFLSEAALMSLVGLIYLRYWKLTGFVGAAWLIPFSRNSIMAAFGLSILWLWGRSRISALALMTVAAIFLALQIGPMAQDPTTAFKNTTLGVRASFWINTVGSATPWGSGVGGFFAEYPNMQTVPTAVQGYDTYIRPRTAHNDAITTLAETGIIGFGLMVAFLAAVLRGWSGPGDRTAIGPSDRAAHAVVFAFLFLGIAGFPLYQAATGLFAAVSAGFLCRGGTGVRPDIVRRRLAALLRNPASQ